MGCNLERRMRRTFTKEELVPYDLKLVFCYEQLTKDRELVTAFPDAIEHHCHQHRTDLLSHIVQKLFD